MRKITLLKLLSVLVSLPLLQVNCGSKKPATVQDNLPVAYVDSDGSHESPVRDSTRNPFPHLKLEGGRITINDRCPVTKAPLNRRLPVLFVNGQAVGFC